MCVFWLNDVICIRCATLSQFFSKFLFFGLLSFSHSRCEHIQFIPKLYISIFTIQSLSQSACEYAARWTYAWNHNLRKGDRKTRKNIGWNKFQRVIESTFRIECACELDTHTYMRYITVEFMQRREEKRREKRTTTRDKMLAIDKCRQCRTRHLRFSLTQAQTHVNRCENVSVQNLCARFFVSLENVDLCQAHKSIALLSML